MIKNNNGKIEISGHGTDLLAEYAELTYRMKITIIEGMRDAADTAEDMKSIKNTVRSLLRASFFCGLDEEEKEDDSSKRA